MTTKANFFRVLAGTVAAALAASLLVLAVAAGPARAAFPGENGKIAFSVDDWGYGSGCIYTMNPDGSGQTRLTYGSGGDSEPAYTPDGSKIVFTSARDGNTEIYVMNSDGSGQTRLTNDPASDSQPAFSSDGSKIAFTSERGGNAEIYVLNTDGSGTPIRLTSDGSADVDPAFSPDGSKIAFTSESDGNKEVYAMDADGADLIRLTNDPTHDFQPAYAPDGSKIAFATKRDGLNSEVYVMNQDGSGQTGLTNGSDDYTDFGPTFSPDGSKIAFESYFSCEEGYCAAIIDGGISTMNSDGSGRVILTNSSVEQGPDWGTQTPDTTPPDTSITSGPSDPTNDNTPTFYFGGSDDRSASASLLFSYKLDNGEWSSYSTGTSATLGGASGHSDGSHTFYVKAKDEAGNEDASPAQRSFTVDTTAPTGSVVINNGADRTRSRTVTLALNATDPSTSSGVTRMRVSNSQSGLSSAVWESYATSKSWTLSSGTGTKAIYVQYKDAVGNISAVVQDTIKYSP